MNLRRQRDCDQSETQSRHYSGRYALLLCQSPQNRDDDREEYALELNFDRDAMRAKAKSNMATERTVRMS